MSFLMRPSATAGATVLEDHEGGTLPYTGDTGDFSNVADSTLEGSRLVQAQGTTAAAIAHDTETTTRGNRYRCRLYLPSTGVEAFFMVGCQSATTPETDCYRVQLDELDGHAFLQRRSTGAEGNATLASDTSVTLSAPAEYRIEIDYAPTGQQIVARILDSTDTVLTTLSQTDDNHSGGTFGFISTNDAPADQMFDHVTEEPL